MKHAKPPNATRTQTKQRGKFGYIKCPAELYAPLCSHLPPVIVFKLNFNLLCLHRKMKSSSRLYAHTHKVHRLNCAYCRRCRKNVCPAAQCSYREWNRAITRWRRKLPKQKRSSLQTTCQLLMTAAGRRMEPALARMDTCKCSHCDIGNRKKKKTTTEM